MISEFVASHVNRAKDKCADIGQFLMLLTVASRPWAEIVEPVLAETFARNVLWVGRDRGYRFQAEMFMNIILAVKVTNALANFIGS